MHEYYQLSSIQSLSSVQFIVTPWTAAHQASLSIPNSWSLLKLMSIESLMLSNHLILCPSPCPSPFHLSQHQGLFQCQFFASSGQSIRVSASASVLPMNIQDWFPLGWTRWISLQSKGLSRVFSKASILWCSAFFIVQLSHSCMTTGKTIAWLDRPCWQSNVSAF